MATEWGGRGAIGNKDREAVVATDHIVLKHLGHHKDFYFIL